MSLRAVQLDLPFKFVNLAQELLEDEHPFLSFSMLLLLPPLVLLQ